MDEESERRWDEEIFFFKLDLVFCFVFLNGKQERVLTI